MKKKITRSYSSIIYTKKYWYLWCIILFLSLFLRLYRLDLNPVGLSHDDELHELINAKSLAIAGSNLPVVAAGIFTKNVHCIMGDCVVGELESYMLIPWMRFFPLDIVLSKLPFVFGSLILVIATGKLFENLSKNPAIGIIVGFLVAVNPWAIYFGRTAYAHNFSYVFYILGLYFFTRYKSYKSNLILGSILSMLASLFYFGAKPILPLIIIWGIIYNLRAFKIRSFKFTLTLILIISSIIILYLIMLSNSYAGTRFTEIGDLRGNNIKSFIDQQVFRLERYLNFFSLTSLFLKGQIATDNYYISNNGYYYLIDLPFLIFGIMAISVNFNRVLPILFLLLVSILPVALKTSETSIYSLRAGLSYPLLSGIIGWGYYFCWSKIYNRFFAKIFLASIIIIYLISITYFLILYWYRLPKVQSDRWFFHERVLSSYISRAHSGSDRKIIVVTARPDGVFNSFIFYSGFYNEKKSIIDINNIYLRQNFQYNGVKFINDCINITKEELKNSTIFIDRVNPGECAIDQSNTQKIANPRDAGGIFNIVNEFLCLSYPKNRYPNPKNINDFNLENMTDEAFCKMWITNPD